MRFLKTSNLILKSLTLVALLALAGCSAKQETSSVKMTFPDWDDVYRETVAGKSGLATFSGPDTSKIDMIAISITGADGTAIRSERWNRKDDSNDLAPREFELKDIPAGSGRLVQVVAVYEDNASTQFLYGDTTVNIQGGVVEAAVMLVMTHATTAQPNTVGRYIGTLGTTYTGPFQYRYAPTGKPSVVVSTGEIFAGWLDVFSLKSPVLKHTKPDGTQLFDLSTYASVFQPGVQTSAARLHVPAGFEDRGNEMESGPERQLDVGFFGPGAYLHRICLNGNRSTVNGYYDTATKINEFVWAGKLGAIAGKETYSVTVVDPDLTAPAYEKGGDDSGTCAQTGVEYVDYLRLDETRLGNSDHYLGFRGPFARIPGVAGNENGGMITKEFSNVAQTATVRFSPLPGTVEALGGFKVFYRSMATAQEANEDDESLRGNDGYRCGEFAGMGFASVNASSPANAYPYIHEAVIPAISSELAAEKLQIVVCPYAKASDGGGFFETGLRYHGPYSNGGGGGGGGGGGTPPAMATKLVITSLEGSGFSAASRRAAGNGVCYAVNVVATDASGNPGMMMSSTTVNIARTDTSNTFAFADADCSTPVTQLNNFMQQQRVYIRDTQSVDRDYDFTFAPTSGLSTGSYYARRVDTVASTDLHMLLPPEIYAHSCVPFDLLAQESTQGAIKAFTGGSINLNTLAGKMTYYAESDWSCSNPIPNTLVLPTNGTSSISLRMKYTGTESNTNIDTTATNGGFSGSIVPATVIVRQPGAPASLQLSIPNQMTEGVCRPFAVQVVDSNGRVTPNMSGAPITFSVATSASGSFKYGCATPTSSPANAGVANTQSSYTSLSYVPSSTGPHTLTITVTSGPAGIFGGTMNVNVDPGVANRVVLVMPGQTWNGSGVSGTPDPVATGAPYVITLYAVRQNGTNDMAFNLDHTGFGLGSSYSPGFYVSSPPMWTSGIGTMTVNFYGTGSAVFMTGNINGLMYLPSQAIPVGP